VWGRSLVCMHQESPTIGVRVSSQFPDDHSERLRSIALLLFAVVIWGMQPLAIKIVLHFFSVAFTAFARSLAASLLFGALAVLQKRVGHAAAPRSNADRVRVAAWLIIGGLGLGFSNIAWNLSLLYTTVGATTVLSLISSVIIALYGIFFLAERCNPLRGGAIFLSLCGMFLISWNGEDLSALVNSRYFLGNLLALAGGVGWALCALAQKVTVRGRSSVSVVAPMFVLSTLLCAFPASFGTVLVGPFSLSMLALMLLTGILGMGLANVLFAQAMRTIPASVGAAVLAVNPLIAFVAASLLLHEPVTVYLLFGAPLTSGGVALAFLSMSASPPSSSDSVKHSIATD